MTALSWTLWRHSRSLVVVHTTETMSCDVVEWICLPVGSATYEQGGSNAAGNIHSTTSGDCAVRLCHCNYNVLLHFICLVLVIITLFVAYLHLSLLFSYSALDLQVCSWKLLSPLPVLLDWCCIALQFDFVTYQSVTNKLLFVRLLSHAGWLLRNTRHVPIIRHCWHC